jgi:hypothetical protein
MKHRIRWYARVTPCEDAPNGFLPKQSSMVVSSFGWDARCSCGWETRTGGAIHARIKESVADHKWDVANGFFDADNPNS